MKHVFINLFMNVARDLPDGGTVTVRTFSQPCAALPAGGLRLSPRFQPDDVAVVAEVAEAAFPPADGRGAPGADADGVARPASKPGGLGLTVLRKIVELYGGMIDMAGRRSGGWKFTIVFRAQTKPSL
jgi:hypothetical protein